MSTEKKEAEGKKTAALPAEKTMNSFPKCYIGPSFSEAYTGTVYQDMLPPALRAVIEQEPVLAALVVPVSKLAEANRALENPESSLAKLYSRAKLLLKKQERKG